MGSNNRLKSSSSFSFTSLFKPWRPPRQDNAWEGDSASSRKVYPSDYDKGRYIAEPDIDNKATVCIAKFHETRASESGRHVIAPPPTPAAQVPNWLLCRDPYACSASFS
ncbi:hypothetical protein NL676_023162 [Syzygium grande]|nr:hypothetical protein NL676_023162 [Syzygium grande]